MASYGRNFDFRVPPISGQRHGRWLLATTANRPIGAPVKRDAAVVTTSFGTGVDGCSLATGAQAPVLGASGVVVYEHAPAAYAGEDPFLTTWSDVDYAPAGKLVQVVNGGEVKVVFTNTEARTFLNTRSYTGRVMVAGVGGATPTVAIGDLLTPGTGNDTDGYWAETSTASEGWLRVTAVDNDRLEVEAQMLF